MNSEKTLTSELLMSRSMYTTCRQPEENVSLIAPNYEKQSQQNSDLTGRSASVGVKME